MSASSAPVGSGPVLGAALAGAGHALVGIATVSERNRERVGAMLPGVPILDYQVLTELHPISWTPYTP